MLQEVDRGRKAATDATLLAGGWVDGGGRWADYFKIRFEFFRYIRKRLVKNYSLFYSS